MTQKSNHYVDKQVLYDDLCEWHSRKEAALAAGQPAPPLPNSIGAVILRLADGMVSRPNFRNYTWADEMRGDGIEAAVKAANKFDPKRVNKSGEVNPFGFLSLVVWRAFVSRIKFEKKINKAKMDSMMDPTTETFDQGQDEYQIDNGGINQFFYENRA
ncbi:RNA polymerase sigma factor [Stenotrophomonas phage Mendera]|uniref:RNA polymerase sigma factor n=2 Tax=Menderavirus TaxID=2843421 RepID=A0A5P8PM01_9CAUD|nr:RNA polymerase sigma factor [Stenotrophomonas phage Moby]YP_009851079.1 RNA polymerase sigma factor [Stenotrophomonas phage Mendera]QXN67397.1 RNA polymerase sigma factor [Stenotrophomonas phage BUCT608]QYW02569.1 RNA polymerase sigma factor [Stenotrophomonas phage Marzo]QFR56571.1 RNA polymerase sigma factor [Stenotrophomonas phage Mendera]QFR57771.1 RNA polymerase sigma factor [Stenotrophomonas phage Moby]QYC97535.1 hypothetical protein [Stenotrophomonas phage BUCT608]